VQHGKTLSSIDFVDNPDIVFDDHESVMMPFRYVKGEDGKPILPEGMKEHLQYVSLSLLLSLAFL
jgi:ribosome biogenesis SPOUT family RNA methylase Rps3